MEFKKIELMRHRSFGDLFSVSFDFIKQNFKLYIKTVLIYVFPFLVLVSFGMGFIFRNFTMESLNSNPESVFFDFFNGSNIAIISFSYLAIIIVSIILYGLSFSFVNLYKKHEDINNLSSQDIWNYTKPHLGWLLGYSILIVAGIFLFYFGIVFLSAAISEWFIGLFFILFFPFMYLMVPLSILYPLKFEEPQIGFVDALKKSFKMTKGSWWESFGFIILFSFLIGLCSYAFVVPAYILMMVLMILELSAIAKFLSIFGMGIFYSLMLLVNGFVYIAIGILFYSLYEKYTGVNLKKQIEQIGAINSDTNNTPNNLTGI